MATIVIVVPSTELFHNTDMDAAVVLVLVGTANAIGIVGEATVSGPRKGGF